MNVLVRASVAAILLLAVGPATASAQPQRSAIWSDLEVPGTLAAFLRVGALRQTVNADEAVLDWIRARDLPAAGSELRSRRVQAYLSTFQRFRSLRAPLGPQISLRTLTAGNRGRVASFLETIGFTLTNQRGTAPLLRPSTTQTAVESRAILESAGLQLDDVETRLNAGETVTLEIPSFKALLPMSPAWWRENVFKKDVPAEFLVNAILEDPNASLLYYGLAATAPSVRAYISASPKLANRLYEQRAGEFAVAAGSLRIRDGRIDVPGGESARLFWEGLVNVSVDDPERFIFALVSEDDGGVAAFYALIDGLDDAHRRFALGLDGASKKQLPRSWTKALYELWFNVARTQWALQRTPLARPNLISDLFFSQVAVDADGRVRGPGWRYLWTAAFETSELPEKPERELKPASARVDALFLAEHILDPSAQDSADRRDTFLFAQRVFGSETESSAPEMLVAFRGFPRFRMLHLTLERIGIRSPRIYAAAIRAASLLQSENADRSVVSLSQFQGALALIERAALTRRISSDEAGRLVMSLSALELDRSGSYGARAALWLERTLVPAVAAAASSNTSPEDRILAGLAGLRAITESDDDPAAEGTYFEWEGWRYRVDPAPALFSRMAKIRRSQSVNSLPSILSLARVTETLEHLSSMADVAESSKLIAALQVTLHEPRMTERLTDEKLVTLRQALPEAGRVLARVKNANQFKNVARDSQFWLEPVVAALTADALRTLAYAASGSDPDSPFFAGGDVSNEHDFGLGSLSRDERERTAWSLPVLAVGQGDRPHVRGALLNLDVAFADLAIRRVASAGVPVESFWTPQARLAFAQTVSLFSSLDAEANDVHRVTNAIAHGRRIVAELTQDAGANDEIFETARLSALRRSLVNRALANGTAIPPLFSLIDLLRIGADEDALDAAQMWGAPAPALTGCLCLSLPPAMDWQVFGGRVNQDGLLPGGTAELMLRIAELVDEMKLPPALIPDILPVAIASFLDESGFDARDDWRAVAERAASLSRSTMEDYVSRVTNGRSLTPVTAVN